MKVRNIAFFGVMASILGVGYANADTPATVIASKAYADTKEATANKKALGSATWSTITDKDSDVKFPTMKVLDSAITNAVNTAVSGVDISGKVDKDQGDENKGKVFVTDNSGKQKVYKLGTNLSIDHTNSELKVGTAALGSAAYTASTNYATSAQGTKADSAIQSVKLNGTALTPDSNKAVNISLGAAASLATEANSVVTSTNTTLLPTVGGVQKGIAKQGTATTSWKTVEENTEGAGANLYASKTKQDDYLPTIKAVETRITEERGLIDTALAGKVNTSSVTNSYSSTGTAPITGTGVAAALGTLDSSAAQSGNKVLTGVTITNGKITAQTDTLIANANVAAAGTANIDYGKMQNALYDINTAAAATCSTTNPCVLTYIGSNKFKWTNMDIDGLPVNGTTN
jgi:hypothetical protein